jgi:predicted HAD superfamily Cof-like phosphohydrolase
MKSIELVREFHEVFGQAIAPGPSIGDGQLNDLRVALLDEELDELAVALQHGDPVATLDALTDLQYVLDGAYLSLGFHAVKDAALAEVHRSNMSKLDSNGGPIYREDGKILKGENYSPPDLARVLERRRVIAFAEAQFDFSDEPTGEYLAANAEWQDSRSGVNKTGEECADCSAPVDAPHRSGCPWIVAVVP